MADYSMGKDYTPVSPTDIALETENMHEEETSNQEESPILPPSSKLKGLNSEELNDPNKIHIEIADEEAPIVILYGPAQCGKTMTLVRLARYLNEKTDYKVEPVSDFRPTYDKNYQEICGDFDEMMNQEDAAQSTNKISFMLVKILNKNGNTICQILEAPGEYYFNPQQPNSAYPRYFSTITASTNRKIWCLFVEPKWGETEDRKNYVTRIEKLKRRIKSRDRVIVIYNKIDDTKYLLDGDGNVDMSGARKNISDRYKTLFEKFRNNTPILRWFKPYNCDFIPFQTGDYPEAKGGDIMFEPGPDVFPKRLWRMILSKVRG